MFSLSRARLRASALVLLLASLFGTLAVAAPPANAMTTFQYEVIHEAARHNGAPYLYGAAGPYRFDCSGYTLYVFGRFGHRLPHNASQQYSVVRHIPKYLMQVGDLIFFQSSSGYIYHVAIYAGGGRMWHAPHTGTTVRLDYIYSSHYVVGRV